MTDKTSPEQIDDSDLDAVQGAASRVKGAAPEKGGTMESSKELREVEPGKDGYWLFEGCYKVKAD